MDFDEYMRKINRGFRKNEKKGVVYFTIPSFERLGFIRHGFTSRIGGVSTGCFSSLNLSFKRENDRDHILGNFRAATGALGIDEKSLVMCHYEHGNNIEFATKEHLGMGITRENELPMCDGVAVTEPGVTAVAIHADCNPIFFADQKGRAAGTCHAGWRGTYNNIAGVIVQKLRERLGIAPEDLLFGIGPSIGPCCFEVKDDVSGLFLDRFVEQVVIRRGEKQFVDLWQTLALELYGLSIPPENITMSGLCTYCNSDLFFSHRREFGKTGAMGSFIQFCTSACD